MTYNEHMPTAQEINKALVYTGEKRLEWLQAMSEWNEECFVRATDEVDKDVYYDVWLSLERDIAEGEALLAAKRYEFYV